MKKNANVFLILFLLIIILFSGKNIYAVEMESISNYIIITKYENKEYIKLRAEGEDSLLKAVKLADVYLNEKEDILKNMNIKINAKLRITFVGFQAELSKAEIERVKKLSFVKDVIKDVEYNSEVKIKNFSSFRSIQNYNVRKKNEMKPLMVSSSGLIGADNQFMNKYSGKGRLISVADNDMYPGHDAFSEAPPEPKLTIQKLREIIPNMNYQGVYPRIDAYYSEKVPFAWNYQIGSNNLNPRNVLSGHGQHISGTMVGKRMNVNGRMWKGIAPDAQIAMMGLSGGTLTTAIEHSLLLGSDAINISLGTAKGKYEKNSIAIYDILERAYVGGLNVVIAAGNEGDFKGDISILTPDYGNIDDPGIVNNAITVGSIENKTVTSYSIQVNGTYFSVNPSNVGGMLPEGIHDYVYVSYGRPEDFEGKQIEGKIVLIKRGENLFMDKIINAQERGAIGVIVYNNIEGEFGMELDGSKVRIPSVAISLKDGEILKSQSNKVLNFTVNPRISQNPKYGEISSFTTYGLTAYGDLKPDILAPGGEVFSTQNSKNTFTNMSGTSMATPHVTAAVALLREYMDKDSKFANLDIKDRAGVVKTLLMNSAIPHMDPKTKVASSTRRQGAGVLDIKRATEVDFTVVNADTNIPSAFLRNIDNIITLRLKVKNYTNIPKVIIPSIATTIESKEGKVITRRPGELFSKTLEDQKFTINGNEEKEVEISTKIENLDKLKDYVNGAFIDGFITLTDNNSKHISFPFSAYKGNFEKLSMIEKPLYDFNFNEEHPMYWNYKFEDHPWQNYSTHIETTYDGRNVIAGVKNFKDISLNSGVRTNPVFEDIVLSPNRDGKNDTLKLYVVATRSGNLSYKIKNDKGQYIMTYDYPKHVFKNFSYLPDANGDRERGYTEFEETKISNLKDGIYTMEIGGAPIREEGKEVENVFKDSIKFRVDNTKPRFELNSYIEPTRTFSFNIIDDSKIKYVYYEVDGQKYNIVNNIFTIPTGKNLEDINIYAVDSGYNSSSINAKVLANINEYGEVRLNINAPDSNNPVNIKYRLTNEDNQEFKLENLIPKGRYRLEILSYYPLYRITSGNIFDIVIDENNRERIIDLNFELKKAQTYKLFKAGDSIGILNIDNIIIKAKNNENNETYNFKHTKDGRFTTELPNGNYTLEYELINSEDSNKFIISFDKKEITIGENNNETNRININEKRNFNINYIINAPEEIKDRITYEIKNYYDEVVELKDLSIGNIYYIYAIVPEGYISIPDGVEIRFSENNLSQDVEFTIVKNEGIKYNLTIEDNLEGAEYRIQKEEDYGTNHPNYIDIKGKQILLVPGVYYLSAKPRENEYFIGKGENNSEEAMQILVSKDTKVIPKWSKYNDEVKVFKKYRINDILTGLKEYTIIIKNLQNEVVDSLKYPSEKSKIIPLKEGVYNIEIPELDDEFDISPKKLYITRFENDFRKRTTNLKVINSEPVSVEIYFMHDGNRVNNINYKVDSIDYSDDNLSIKPGSHNLEIDSTEYKLTSSPRDLIIKKDSKIIEVKLLRVNEEFTIPDKASLKALIDENDDLERVEVYNNLSGELKNNYKSLLNEARRNYKNADVSSDTVNDIINKLRDARNKLIGDYKLYFEGLLKDIIAKSDSIISSYQYTEATDYIKETLDEQLRRAKAIGEEDSIQDIKEGYFNLLDAYNNLDGEKPIDFSKLDELIDESSNVIETVKYINATIEERRNYLVAIEEARELKKDKWVTNERIEEYIERVNTSKEALSGKEATLKTDIPKVFNVYVGDQTIKGMVKPNSNIRINIDGFDYNSSAVSDSGEFIVDVDEILPDSKITVYSTERGFIESDGLKVKVLPKDNDNKLENLISEYYKFIETDYFKKSDKILQDKYSDACELARRMLSNKVNKDERKDLEELINSAKKLILGNFIKVKFKSGKGEFIKNKLNIFIIKKGITIDDAKKDNSIIIPEIIYTENQIGWITSENHSTVYSLDLSDYNVALNKDVTFIAKFNDENRKDGFEDNKRDIDISRREKTLSINRNNINTNIKTNVNIPLKTIKQNNSALDIREKRIKVEFIDIKKSPYYDAIENMASRGILKGMGNNKFEPNTTITRAMISEVLMRMTKDKSIDNINVMKDIRKDAWYFNSVNWAVKNRIVNGYEDGTFRPEQKITNEELFVMIARFLDFNKFIVEIKNDIDVDDIKSSNWSKTAIIKLYSHGLLTSDYIKSFDAKSEVKREELANILNKIVELVQN